MAINTSTVLEATLFGPLSPVRQLTHLFEAFPDAIVLKDGEGRWLLANALARELYELESRPWQGRTDRELAAGHPRLQALHEQGLADDEATWQAGVARVFEIGITDATGERRDYALRKVPLPGGPGARGALFVIGRDITRSKQADQALHIADVIFETQESIMVTDVHGVILRVNQAFTRLTGYEAADVVGRTPAILQSGRHDKAFYQAMWDALRWEKFWQGEIWDRRKNGDIYPKWLTITAVTEVGGPVTHYVGAFTDLSRSKEAEETIHLLAFYDALTDLPNRRLMCDRLHRALAGHAISRQHGAVLVADVDNFKGLNDSKGYETGDQVLQEVARRMRANVRQDDTVARMDGDEFALLLEGLSTQEEQAAVQARGIAEKILESVNQPWPLDGQEHHVSLSIGISLFSEQDIKAEEVLMRADAAMHQAKNAGRNTLCFFNPEQQAQLKQRATLELELRSALEKQQLRLYYQPQVDHGGRVLGAEVLLRWQHERRGLVSPAEFIPIAEETGLILPMGEWVLTTACAQLKVWEETPQMRDFMLAVNVSARQFRQPEFVALVVRVLTLTGANPRLLKLELTESLVLHNVADTIQKMEALRQYGICFSLDDFGTGYSSLAHLSKLPLDQLKIDQSFVRDIVMNPHDATIVQTIIGMAGNLGLNVIAEGVETEAQRICLERYQCPVYQGYLSGRPMPLPEFESLVRQVPERPWFG